MSLIRKHGAVLQAWACLDLVGYSFTMLYKWNGWLVAWSIGNIVGRINKVTLHWARLVLRVRWVTIHRYTVFVYKQATLINSAWPSVCG